MSCYENEEEKEFDIYEGQIIGTCKIEKIKVIDEEEKIYNITVKCFRCNETYTISNCSNDKFLIGELLSCSCEKGDTAILQQGEVSFINRPRNDINYYIYKDNALNEIKYNILLEETNKLVKEFEEQIENGELNPDIPNPPTPPDDEDDEDENPDKPTGPKEYYDIILDESRYGEIETNKNEAKPGDEIIITVIPNEGYEVRRVSVDDENSDEVPVLNLDNNKYSFIMPSMDVSIKIRYRALDEEEA